MNKFRHTSLIILVLFSLLLGGLYGYAMYTINTTSKRVHDLSKELADRTQETQSMKHLKELTNDASDRKQKLLGYTVQPDQTVKFVELIENQTKMSDATTTITSIDIDQTATIANLESLMLSIQTSGTWKSVIGVLTALESLPYKINISHLSLQSNGKGEEITDSSVSQWGSAITFNVLKQKDSNPTTTQ